MGLLGATWSLAVLGVAGGLARLPARRPAPASPEPVAGDDNPDRILRRRVVAVVAVLLGSILAHPAPVLVVAGLVAARPRLRHRLEARRRNREGLAELPWLVGLLRMGVVAGLPVGNALAEACARSTGPASAGFRDAIERSNRGSPLAGEVDRLRPLLGEAGRPLVTALVASLRLGAPVGPALEAAAADLRTGARRRAETRARKVPVRMLFPLALCVMPAFVLLSVVPMVLDALGNLDLGP